MPRILVHSKQPQMRRLLPESLCFDGYQVDSVVDADMLWEHLDNGQPELVLLDAHKDGFGAMKLYFDIKEKHPDLSIIVYQCNNYGDVKRIKDAVADELGKQGKKVRSSTFRVEKMLSSYKREFFIIQL